MCYCGGIAETFVVSFLTKKVYDMLCKIKKANSCSMCHCVAIPDRDICPECLAKEIPDMDLLDPYETEDIDIIPENSSSENKWIYSVYP